MRLAEIQTADRYYGCHMNDVYLDVVAPKALSNDDVSVKNAYVKMASGHAHSQQDLTELRRKIEDRQLARKLREDLGLEREYFSTEDIY